MDGLLFGRQVTTADVGMGPPLLFFFGKSMTCRVVLDSGLTLTRLIDSTPIHFVCSNPLCLVLLPSYQTQDFESNVTLDYIAGHDLPRYTDFLWP